MRFQLVPYWRKWYRLHSVRVQAAMVALAVWWIGSPPEWKAAVPERALAVVMAIGAVLTIAGALTTQDVAGPGNKQPGGGNV